LRDGIEKKLGYQRENERERERERERARARERERQREARRYMSLRDEVP
jgi:hypothetical protein